MIRAHRNHSWTKFFVVRGDVAFFAVINVITRKGLHSCRVVKFSFADASYETYQGRASYSTHVRDLISRFVRNVL